MKRICSLFGGIGVCLAILMILSGPANAAPEKTREMAKKAKPGKIEAAAEGFEEVDLFQAIEDGQIEAGVIQRNMKEGRLFIENKTDKPLNVRIPETFGTRPIASQMQIGRQDDIEQLFGTGGGGGIMGGGGGFNIPSEKVVSMKYESVCLEYGKPVPTSRSDYELAKIDEVTDKEEVKEMCKLIGRGVDLGALQFAAWHMNSGVPVQKLASETVLRANGKRTTYFSEAQVKAGMMISQRARTIAQQKAEAAQTHSSSASE